MSPGHCVVQETCSCWLEEWGVIQRQVENPKDTEEFWSGVLSNEHFKELTTYALTYPITPCSNEVVERTFSLVKNIKKNRNRMQLKLLGAPVRIRSHLMYSGTCCKDFVVNPCNAGPFQFTVSLRFSCLLNRTTKPVSDEEEMLLALTRQHRVYM